MTWLQRFLSGFYVFAFILLFGCSKSGNSVIPISPTESDSLHHFSGIWDANFDIESFQVDITPNRVLNEHYNVTTLFPAPDIQINSYDPSTEIVDVDITIVNPYQLNAFDLRLIIYTDSYGHLLVNHDDWTPLFDIPSGETINPFKAYAKNEPERVFAKQARHTENCLIYLPGGNTSMSFAIELSFPGHCREPYSIENFTQEMLCERPGDEALAEVDVLYWKESVNEVYLYCPEITDAQKVYFYQTSDTTWQLSLINVTGALPGEYTGIISARTIHSASLALYDKVTISIVDSINTGWAHTWGNMDQDRCNAVATDSAGNIYVTGSFELEVDFDPGSGEELHDSNGQSDIFLSKFDSSGDFLWAKTWGAVDGAWQGGNPTDSGNSIAIDSLDNLYITGFFNGDADFDPGPTQDFHPVQGELDAFLNKFDSDGNFIWAVTWGGVEDDVANYVSVGESDNIFVTGDFYGNADFDPGSGSDWHQSNGDIDSFLVKFNSDGDFERACTWGGIEHDMAKGVDTDSTGNIFVTGRYQNVVDFNPGPGENWHTSTWNFIYMEYSFDAYVSKFNPDGGFIWARTWGGDDGDYCNQVVTDSSNNCIVSGNFASIVDFDPGPESDQHVAFGGYDSFISKFNSSGIHIWAHTWGGNNWDSPFGVALDNSDNIFVTGRFYEVVDFDPGTDVDEHISIGARDIFLSKFNLDGEFIWARTWGSPENDSGLGIATDINDNVFITGYFRETVDFDPGPGIDEHTAVLLDEDAFLVKLLPNGYWE